MTIAIVILMLVAYIIIASEHMTNINKATTAMFAGVLGWILYMCVGTSFVNNVHAEDFADFLDGRSYTVSLAKEYIANHIFIHHSAFICSIVLYLLSTMAIVDVLAQNGCFDFISSLARSRNRNRVLWGLTLATFLLSANLDNLTTTVIMFIIMHRLIVNEYQRKYLGAAIVISAICGGTFTVIGDVTSLMVWTKEAVTPTDFTSALILPSMVATAIPVFLIGRKLPENLDIHRSYMEFRGDVSTMPIWQRAVMLFIGIGGLWFVPTFYRITKLPPFLGALCVLGVIWVLNEVFNRRSIRTEQPTMLPGSDRRLQYEVLQVIMFFIGVSLAVSVMVETGAMHIASQWLDKNIHNAYILSAAVGLVSAMLDNVCMVLLGINFYEVVPREPFMSNYIEMFCVNGQYWHLVIFSGCVGGLLLPIGNTAGYALMRSEDVSVWWYVKNITGKVVCGWALGLVTYFFVDLLLR